jgi:hypothetical protein
MIRYNYEVDQKEFFDYKLARLPSRWRQNALDKWQDIAKSESIKAANEWLRALIEPLENLLNIAHDDDDINALADELSFKCRESAQKNSWQMLFVLDNWQELCLAYAVRYPIEFDCKGIEARLCDRLWWLKKLRQSHARAREVAAINAGLVHRGGNLYVSDDTLDRRDQQKRRNAHTLEGVKLQSESGQVMSLAEIAAAGVSNPENRRAELMTRITGFEELSIKYGHHAEFITVTCPSRMHAVLRNGKPNPKYDGTKPDEAQRYMVEVWARVRAKFHRDGFRFYGLRVAEPHHDGTPHWHLIVFYKPEKIRFKDGRKYEAKHYMRGVIRNHFLADSGDEVGAMQNRVKFVAINPLKGTAAGYVVKYVSKNIGGIEGEKSDESETDSTSAAARVDAWASTWRIRQFQQVGGHSVSVWRELRRVNEKDIPQDLRNLMRAWRAVQGVREKGKANYAEFIEAMGGLNTKARESFICLDDDFVMKRGRYGEAVSHLVHGVRERFGFGKASNNRESWERI